MILTFDPNHYLSEIILVGCGGTGGHWANGIARIVRMMKDAGKKTPHIKFIDPDHFEMKNVGRQLAHDVSIGENKAIEMARRFNMALGLNIEAIPEAFYSRNHVSRNSGTIICGAVDNWEARKAISEAKDAIWIDGGNSRYTGQVIIGTSSETEWMQSRLKSMKKEESNVRWLPNAVAVFPELLKPDPEEEGLMQSLSCAELMELSLQSATINGMIAGIGSEYLRKLLYREPIKSWITHVDSTTLTMRSSPITVDNIIQNTPALKAIL